MQIKETMTTKELTGLLQKNFQKLTEDVTHLFVVNVSGDNLWAHYLESFPFGTNEVYRERRERDCNCCRQFVRNFGNVVIIKNNVLTTIWDFETNDPTFQPVLDALDAYIKSHAVSDVFINKIKKIGTERNFEQLADGKVAEWNHLFIELPTKFVDKSSKSEATVKSELRAIRQVFKRSLDELTEESLETVLDLILRNSLYKGEEWKGVLTEFLKYKKDYDQLTSDSEKELFAWEQSIKAGAVIGKIRNHSMGTLLVDISENMDLATAVKKYEKIVAGPNYKRVNPVHSQRQLNAGRKFIEEKGYMESLPRRYAVLDDITVNNILFSNKDAAKRIAGANVFDEMAAAIPVSPKRFSRVEEVTADDFVKNILPKARELELLLENKHAANMVSLIAPVNPESKNMFKWSNRFSWAYSGNMTDSDLKQNVKNAGGNVEGVLRFSIQWNDENLDENDLDAHCYEPSGNQLYFRSKNNYTTTGQLDVDIINPVKGTPAVENITWTDKSKMQKGTYKFFVNNFSHRGGRTGFKAEIEFDGQVYSFHYNKELRQKEKVQVAEVYFDGVNFTIKELLPSNVSTKEVWNLTTNQFAPITVVMYSPNYWDKQNGIGHRHYMFMLKDCVNTESPNGFYNEFLKEEFREHRHVMEALGGKMAVKNAEDQLSGVGFSATKRDEVVIKVKEEESERMVKVKF